MTNADTIKTALARSKKAISRQPSAGIGCQSMLVTVAPNGCAMAVSGDDTATIDLSKMWGGDATTPGAGFWVKAALGACFAQSYYIHALDQDVQFDEISVELHGEYDMRGNLGLDDSIPPGLTVMRYVVNIRSSEPEEKIMQVLNHSDKHDFVRDIFARATPMVRVVNITRPE